MRRAELSETLAGTPSILDVLDGMRKQVEDLALSSEVGEVLEREVDSSSHIAGGTQFSKLVELLLSAGHATTIHPGAEQSLDFG